MLPGPASLRRVPAAPGLPASRRSRPSSPPEGGFTLIEVLVALIVLVLGVLGAAAMTLTSLRDNKQSALRSQGSGYAYELADLMRANAPSDPASRAAVEAIFTSAPGAVVAACYTSAGCSPTDMATSDFAQWAAKVTSTTAPSPGLPNASYKICRDATSLASMTACDNLATSPLVIKLKWDEKFNNGTYVADQSGNSTRPNLVLPVQPY